MENYPEVKPRVRTMPGAEAFHLQTGGSARQRQIKPQGQAPTVFYPVSGVPGHTHNSSAVASVLCDLSRNRGFEHEMTLNDHGWSSQNIALGAADAGDSEPVADEDARFDRALERGIGSITLIPENCHQQIREPCRAISEVRRLVTPKDRLRCSTYVEEVGGFVAAAAPHAPYISDYPDILVDLIGPVDPDQAQQAGGVYTAKIETTPVVIVPDNTRWGEDGVKGTAPGADKRFVVLRGAAGASIGTVDGEPWYGIVPFRWVQNEKLYRSEPFTCIFRNVIEVGPKPAAGALPINAHPNASWSSSRRSARKWRRTATAC